jgi:hypothetical protein
MSIEWTVAIALKRAGSCLVGAPGTSQANSRRGEVCATNYANGVVATNDTHAPKRHAGAWRSQ